ncbi:MAG TPA: hypothetical protein ENJ95_20820 [Bacteroidetes bacterium]|nr:hypothetical protein [Bacteroidota bacterium]
MKFAICHISIVPLRNAASNKSEQLSQLLFGEVVEILETKGKMWTKVRCDWDNCIGWVLSKQVKAITDKEYGLFEEKYAYCLDLFQPLMSDNESMPISIGSRLPDFDGMKFTFDSKTYFYSGQAVFPENLQPSVDKVLKIARRYLSAPYQWGGRSPMGIDAPGLTQMVLKLVGIQLLRNADQQVHQGELIDFIEQSQPGDLAFFENKAGNISHVGILLPDNNIIHAAEKVRIDSIDHFGIFDKKINKYTHRLRVVKRMLPPEEFPVQKIEEKIEASPQVLMFD